MAKQSNGSKTDTAVKLVLIFFISLLSFSLGTFVGKQVSDSDHRRAALEADYQQYASQEEDDANYDDAITEEDVASLTKEFVEDSKADLAENREPASAENNSSSSDVAPEGKETSAGYRKLSGKKADKEAPTAEKAAKAKEPKSKEAPKEVSKAAARVAKGKAPAKDKKVKKSRKPNSVLPSVASSAVGKYTVQVASYAAEDEAKTHAASLKGQGWNAFYVPADVKGRTWYRVSVGLFTSSSSANKFREELMKEAKLSSAIVQKIVN